MESDRGPERLLVVEDEQPACALISTRLRQHGFHVEIAKSGAEALDIIDAEAFDLVLLDRVLPGLNGDGVLKELRCSHSPAELPVIMVSTLDDGEDIAEALLMGANDYITKPNDFTIALARIRSQLLRKRSQRV